MKNSRLQVRFSRLKKSNNTDVTVLSSNEELSILGGRVDGCPVLTSCNTYVECGNKYKTQGPISGTITIKV